MLKQLTKDANLGTLEFNVAEHIHFLTLHAWKERAYIRRQAANHARYIDWTAKARYAFMRLETKWLRAMVMEAVTA